jgi:ATP-binding cassette subfamily G (WHITE) protein 2
VFRRERSAGLYRLSAYFLSLTTVELPMTGVLPTMYVTIIYWLAGLTASAANFISFWIVLLLNVFMSQV